MKSVNFRNPVGATGFEPVTSCLKGKQKVDGEVGFMFMAYLFTRMKIIPGFQGLWEATSSLLSLYLTSKLAGNPLKIDSPAFWNNFLQKSTSYRFFKYFGNLPCQ